MKNISKKLYFFLGFLTFATWGIVIFIVSGTRYSDLATQTNLDIIVEKLGYFFAFGLLFLLLFNTFIIGFKYKVNKLARWKSKREKNEDIQFVMLVEFLLLLVSALFVFILVMFDAYFRKYVMDKFVTYNDILISTLGVLLFAFLSFVLPHTAEIERYIQKTFNLK